MTSRPRATTLLWACLFALIGFTAVFHGLGADSWMGDLMRTGIPVVLIILGALGLWTSRANQH